jgi:hypothetical protein
MNDYQKAQLVWNYIISLEFNCECAIEMTDSNTGCGYEIFIDCGSEEQDEDEDEID